MTAKLTWDVFVEPPAPLAGDEAGPGQMERTWSPISATLISGEHDAVLIDALLTADRGRELADWVAARGKNLTSVYVTHGQGDHWFGLGSVLLADNPVLAAPLHHTGTDATTVLHVPELDLAGPGAKRRNDSSPMLLHPDQPCVFEEAS